MGSCLVKSSQLIAVALFLGATGSFVQAQAPARAVGVIVEAFTGARAAVPRVSPMLASEGLYGARLPSNVRSPVYISSMFDADHGRYRLTDFSTLAQSSLKCEDLKKLIEGTRLYANYYYLNEVDGFVYPGVQEKAYKLLSSCKKSDSSGAASQLSAQYQEALTVHVSSPESNATGPEVKREASGSRKLEVNRRLPKVREVFFPDKIMNRDCQEAFVVSN